MPKWTYRAYSEGTVCFLIFSPALAAPVGVGRDGHLPARIHLRVIHVQFERSPLVSLYEREQILALVQHWVSSDDVVWEPVQTRYLRRRVRVHFLPKHDKCLADCYVSIDSGEGKDSNRQ